MYSTVRRSINSMKSMDHQVKSFLYMSCLLPSLESVFKVEQPTLLHSNILRHCTEKHQGYKVVISSVELIGPQLFHSGILA